MKMKQTVPGYGLGGENKGKRLRWSAISLPQMEECPLGGSNKKGSHVYSVDSCHGTTIVMSDCTIVTSGHHCSITATFISNNSTI